MDPKAHWEAVYCEKAPESVSWYQKEARFSLALIRRVAPPPYPAIIDVGGGASTLVDGLLSAGYPRVTVLDLSGTALAAARRRLGAAARGVEWLERDVLDPGFAPGTFDVWHDRAVFHFLTSAMDRQRYVEQVRHSLRAGGHVLVATFATDGPTRCSGLDVVRYSATTLHAEFGAGFRVVGSAREEHITPWGLTQAFTYCLCRYEPEAIARPAA